MGHNAAGVEGDGEIGGGDRFREIGQGEDIETVLREESVQQRSAERFNRVTDSGEGILRILKEIKPSRAGKADLVRKTAHECLFLGEGSSRSSEFARRECGCQGKMKTKRIKFPEEKTGWEAKHIDR